MAKEKGVAVFCAASENIDKLYVDAAHEVGTMLGRIGVSLVYGGARFGLMEATATGNLISQIMYDKKITLTQAREIIKETFEIKEAE